MAIRIFLSNSLNKCIFSNIQFHRMKFHVQNVLKKNYNSGGKRPDFLSEQIELHKHRLRHLGQGNNRKFWKTVFFALTFSGATYVGATILEYERIRARKNRFNGIQWKPHDKHTSRWLQEIKRWWNNLSDGEKVFFSLFTLNLLVFAAWKIPACQPFMVKHFTNHPDVPFLPSVLSMFSHYNVYHLLGNMYALYTFSTPTVQYLGREHFVALYLISGVFANVFSNAYKIFTYQNAHSLGASGAIMGIVGYFCSQFPETRLSIIFLPFFTLNADIALKSLLALETTGCIMKWKLFDHAAHLGGILFGLFWCHWGIEHIWRKRTTIMMYWHSFRDPKSR